MKHRVRLLGRTAVYLAAALASLPSAVSADTSIVQQVKHNGAALTESHTRTLQVKGLKMRVESRRGSETYTYIYDLEAGKGYRLDPKHKEVFVGDLAAQSRELEDVWLVKDMQKAIKPTGKKAEIGGLACDEYLVAMQAPGERNHGRQMVLHDTGTLCVSQSIPSGVEFTHFVHEAQKRGYTSLAASCSASRSPLGAYLYDEQSNLMVLSAKTKSFAEGVPGKPSDMVFIETSMTVVAINSDLIPEDAFQIPTDWKVKKDSQPVSGIRILTMK
jgi:hypothetical protein